MVVDGPPTGIDMCLNCLAIRACVDHPEYINQGMLGRNAYGVRSVKPSVEEKEYFHTYIMYLMRVDHTFGYCYASRSAFLMSIVDGRVWTRWDMQHPLCG